MSRFDVSSIRAALVPSRADLLAPEPQGKLAAVAVVLRAAAPGPEVLLIRRTERQGDPWSGHMAFPGGRRDVSDPHLLFTAERETREEVGLDLQAHGVLLGRLDDLEVMPRMATTVQGWIRPYVFEVTETPALRLDAREVAEVHWAPLEPMRSGTSSTTIRWERQGASFDFPGWDVAGNVVWGLTYRMLSALFERVATAHVSPSDGLGAARRGGANEAS